MPWFKVDDRLGSHPKVLRTSDAAMGLWLRAGAHCSLWLTDGRIDAQVLPSLTPSPPATVRRLAAELVAAGLWDVTDDGWTFRNWSEWQPTADAVEQKRAAEAERQRRSRERRKDQSPR